MMATIALLAFDGFNELDTFAAMTVLGRVADCRVLLCSGVEELTSMNGVRVRANGSLEDARLADAVVFGSGKKTASQAQDRGLLARMRFSPERQFVCAQCSGALFLSQLGFLKERVACTDRTTKPMLEAQGVQVLQQSFYAKGLVATAGGCLSSIYLAAFLLARLHSHEQAWEAIRAVAPVDETDGWVARVQSVLGPYV